MLRRCFCSSRGLKTPQARRHQPNISRVPVWRSTAFSPSSCGNGCQRIRSSTVNPLAYDLFFPGRHGAREARE
eukprot:3567127-Pyramimonas_sp.AAC.1